MDDLAHLRIAQLFDTQLPVGAFAHSGGLETYGQSGMTADGLRRYLHHQLLLGWGRLDLALTALAHAAETPDELERLCDEAHAWKVIPGLRDTSLSMGKRLRRLAAHLWPEETAALPRLPRSHQAVIIGALGAALSLPLRPLLLSFAQSLCAGALGAATRCMPLGPRAAQTLLVGLQPHVIQAVERVLQDPEASLFAATPGADIRAHQQRHLYTRLFQS